jgi:serine/threonine protein kinase
MEHLHGLGVVHGDIKPSNVFRLRSKWVLGDYDSAVLSDSALPVAASTRATVRRAVSGAECDTYALGKVLYELWTGNDRLEYPNLPGRLVSRTRWTRAERLLNDLANGLRSPVDSTGFGISGFIRETLSASCSV